VTFVKICTSYNLVFGVNSVAFGTFNVGPTKIGNVLAKVGLGVGFSSCDGPTRDGRFDSDGRFDLKEEEREVILFLKFLT